MAGAKVVDNGFAPSVWQLEFLRHPAKVKLALCGLGSGKSALGANLASALMFDPRACALHGIPHPNFGWVVGQDFPTVLNTSWREMKKFLPPGAYQANEQLHRIQAGGSECQFVACDDPDSLRAGNVNWIWLDEPGIVRNSEVWRNILGRLRRGVASCAFLTGTPKGFTWLHDDVWAKAARTDLLTGNERPSVRELRPDELAVTDPAARRYDDYWAIRVPSWLSGRVTQEDIDRFQDENSPDWFMQEYGADFRSYTGLVYAEFNPQRHIRKNPVPCAEWWGALDWGYSHPAAGVLVGRDGARLHVQTEYYQTRTDPEDQIDWAIGCQQRMNTIAWVADTNRADLIAKARAAGLVVWPAEKGDNSIASGIEEVRRYLRGDNLTVDVACRHTLREFSLYRYPDGGRGGVLEKPIDRDNHVMDALRYLCWALRALPAREAEPERHELPFQLRSPLDRQEVSYWAW